MSSRKRFPSDTKKKNSAKERKVQVQVVDLTLDDDDVSMAFGQSHWIPPDVEQKQVPPLPNTIDIAALKSVDAKDVRMYFASLIQQQVKQQVLKAIDTNFAELGIPWSKPTQEYVMQLYRNNWNRMIEKFKWEQTVPKPSPIKKHKVVDLLFKTFKVAPTRDPSHSLIPLLEKKQILQLSNLVVSTAPFYCLRNIEPKHFMAKYTPNLKKEIFLCPVSIKYYIKQKTPFDDIGKKYLTEGIKNAQWISIAVAFRKDQGGEIQQQLIGFALAEEDPKDVKTLELTLFCAGATATLDLSFQRDSPVTERSAVSFMEYWEKTMQELGYQRIRLRSTPTSERFWYNRGYRYEKCTLPHQFDGQDFCQRDQRPKIDDRDFYMHKCFDPLPSGL